MSSYWTSDQSSPETARTDTSANTPIIAREGDDFENLQSSWPAGYYDPFSGRPTQEQVSARTYPRPPPNPQQSGWQRGDSHPAPFPQGATHHVPQGREVRALDPTRSFQPDNPFHHGRESNPPHARGISTDTSRSFVRGVPISEPGAERAVPTSGKPQRADSRYQPRRRPFNQDEFDGPAQLLPMPHSPQEQARAQVMPVQPIHLTLEEQEDIFRQANDILAHCAFHFVAKYQFPIPLERDKSRIRLPNDREWAEWAYLLKRLATKRRIPARVLYENQIKQFVTTLENSIMVRHHPPTARPGQAVIACTPKDDRYILQVISSGIQVAKILMDSLAMTHLDELYTRTESVMLDRRNRARLGAFEF